MTEWCHCWWNIKLFSLAFSIQRLVCFFRRITYTYLQCYFSGKAWNIILMATCSIVLMRRLIAQRNHSTSKPLMQIVKYKQKQQLLNSKNTARIQRYNAGQWAAKIKKQLSSNNKRRAGVKVNKRLEVISVALIREFRRKETKKKSTHICVNFTNNSNILRLSSVICKSTKEF